ncbi:hypothetical protein [Cupriavidus necator]|uniref:hypothetical protein n=1 Tax=Cupriavidus necator TaxID=106590 RepID=UPI0027828962|nr:hypothetical protein [Cupriavidus necator]MDQ0138563.1 hypothetical protein [Cupriavidus necator]
MASVSQASVSMQRNGKSSGARTSASWTLAAFQPLLGSPGHISGAIACAPEVHVCIVIGIRPYRPSISLADCAGRPGTLLAFCHKTS